MDNTTDATQQPQAGPTPPQPTVDPAATQPIVEPQPTQQVIQPTENPLSANTVSQPNPSNPSMPVAHSQPPDGTVGQPQQPQAMSTAPMNSHADSVPKGKKILLMAIIIVVFVLAFASAAYFALENNKAKNDIEALKSQIAVLDANTHELPEGLIQVTDCIPNMGFHYIDPNNDPRFGPIYLVSKDGEVIGYEFMFNNSMLTSIPGQEIALEVLLTDGPIDLHDWQFNSIDFSRSPEGHDGFEEDHSDVHLYTVTPEEQARACE